MKLSDLFRDLAAVAVLKPCFFRNKVKTALASSLSAVNKVGGTALVLRALCIRG